MCAGLLLTGVVSYVLGQSTLYGVELLNSSQESVDEIGQLVCNQSCPTWTVPQPENPACCVCGQLFGDIVRCDQLTLNVSILLGHCMTYDATKDMTYAAKCSYNFNINKPKELYHPLPRSLSNISSAMCDPLHRQGRVCGQCKPGYGGGVFSADINCYRCSGLYHGWLLYFTLELIPVTLLFLFIMIFQCRGTAASQNGHLFLSHMIVSMYQYYPPIGSYPFGKTSHVLITIFLTFYGFFNLDYFRRLVPPFCISEQIDGLAMISLFYIAVVYLLLLNLITYFLIEMHANNCRCLVWLWRPLHKYYVKVYRNVNPRNSLVEAFATSLILSYSRSMLISFNLLHPTPLYTPTGRASKPAVYFDGTLDYFGAKHMPFVILSLAVIFIFNILPIVFLCVYPTKAFQKLLSRPRVTKRAQVVHSFADAFQGCYKNGTSGTRDYRYFAGLYLLLRLLLFTGHIIGGPLLQWLVPGAFLLIMALLFAHLRPYREDIFNTIDSLWLTMASVFGICQAIIAARGVEHTVHYQIIAQIILGVPLVYIVCFNFHHYISSRFYKRVCKKRQWKSRESVTAIAAEDTDDLPYRMLENTIS